MYSWRSKRLPFVGADWRGSPTKIYTGEVVHNREDLNQIGMTTIGHYILTEQIVVNVAPCLCFLAAAFENFPFE